MWHLVAYPSTFLDPFINAITEAVKQQKGPTVSLLPLEWSKLSLSGSLLSLQSRYDIFLPMKLFAERKTPLYLPCL